VQGELILEQRKSGAVPSYLEEASGTSPLKERLCVKLFNKYPTLFSRGNCCLHSYLFFKKHSTNVDIHTRMSTHPYEHTHAYPTSMSTSERLSRLDLKIHEVGHQERLTVIKSASLSTGTSPPTKRIINRNTHVKYKI
jgi:hypothetical protein